MTQNQWNHDSLSCASFMITDDDQWCKAWLVCAFCKRLYRCCTWFSMWRTRSCWTRHCAIVFSSVLWSRFRCLDGFRIKRCFLKFKNDWFQKGRLLMLLKIVKNLLQKMSIAFKDFVTAWPAALSVYKKRAGSLGFWLDGAEEDTWGTSRFLLMNTDEHFFSVIITCENESWETVSCAGLIQQQLGWKSVHCDLCLFFCSWLFGGSRLLKNKTKQCTLVL